MGDGYFTAERLSGLIFSRNLEKEEGIMQNKVYVINKHGRPLMPCSPAKARHLLDDGKAKVKKRTPFTIQLLFGSTGYTQEVILGVDAGSKTIGLSASTETEELFSAEVKPRNDVVDLLSTRREFRRARRNRKTRYRKPRFDNRVRSKHKGWLAPSVEVKIQEHMTAIRRICRILPVSKVVVETAEFDLQLIKAVEEGKPVPQGEDYQKGEKYGHYNVRQYVLWRDGTPANAVEHMRPKRKRCGSMCIIWRVVKSEAMLPAISSLYVRAVMRNSIRALSPQRTSRSASGSQPEMPLSWASCGRL